MPERFASCGTQSNYFFIALVENQNRTNKEPQTVENGHGMSPCYAKKVITNDISG